MKKLLEARPGLKVIARILVVLALILVGFGALHLAPMAHSPSSAVQHSPIVSQCPAITGHC